MPNFCPNCGSKQVMQSNFCTNCGMRMFDVENNPVIQQQKFEPKNRIYNPAIKKEPAVESKETKRKKMIESLASRCKISGTIHMVTFGVKALISLIVLFSDVFALMKFIILIYAFSSLYEGIRSFKYAGKLYEDKFYYDDYKYFDKIANGIFSVVFYGIGIPLIIIGYFLMNNMEFLIGLYIIFTFCIVLIELPSAIYDKTFSNHVARNKSIVLDIVFKKNNTSMVPKEKWMCQSCGYENDIEHIRCKNCGIYK